MTHSKRAFVHTSDVEAAFKVEPKQFKWSGSQDLITGASGPSAARQDRKSVV